MKEYFDVVDENDNIIGKAPRSECHNNPSLRHRSAVVLVFNSKGELLMHKRSMSTDTGPGKWSISAEGHTNLGEGYEHAAARELREELGISADVKLLFKAVFRARYETENYCTFKAVSNGPFKPDPEEVAEVEFFGLNELREQLKKQPDKFTDGCHMVMENYFKRFGK